jgi:Osmosensitive K+ channel histidine kinase
MKERIKIVWILSIFSALLVICMQGYWLYSQYVYSIDRYSSDLATQIGQIMLADYNERSQENKKAIAFNYSYNTINDISESETDSVQRIHKMLSMNLGVRDSLSPSSEMKMHIDTFKLEKGVDAFFRGAIDNYVTEAKNPINKERIDSLVTAAFPDVSFTTTFIKTDSIQWDMDWQNIGTVLNPGIVLIYPYNPLEHNSLEFQIVIPHNPLLSQMSVQLFFGFCFILLLVGCLVFQIKTILKQKELGDLQYSFVNTMIHELKRPVQTLKMLISFLNDKQISTNETSQQVVQDSLFELDNLSAYINKLRDMVHVDSEDTLLHKEHFNIEQMLEKVLRLIHIPSDKQVTFSTSYNLDSPEVCADPVHFANILNNLVENAIKYSDKDVKIVINASMQNKDLLVTVSDNGIGIATAEQNHVFEKFYRGSNHPDGNIPGIGLGLSYVKLITKAHRGSVSLSSHVGEGTTVVINIPQ